MSTRTQAILPNYTCPTCLAKSRMVCVLDNGKKEILKKLGIFLGNAKAVRVCWECSARIQNIIRFQMKANHAQLLLSLKLSCVNCLSTLSVTDNKRSKVFYFKDKKLQEEQLAKWARIRKETYKKLKRYNLINDTKAKRVLNKQKVKLTDLAKLPDKRKPVNIVVNQANPLFDTGKSNCAAINNNKDSEIIQEASIASSQIRKRKIKIIYQTPEESFMKRNVNDKIKNKVSAIKAANAANSVYRKKICDNTDSSNTVVTDNDDAEWEDSDQSSNIIQALKQKYPIKKNIDKDIAKSSTEDQTSSFLEKEYRIEFIEDKNTEYFSDEDSDRTYVESGDDIFNEDDDVTYYERDSFGKSIKDTNVNREEQNYSESEITNVLIGLSEDKKSDENTHAQSMKDRLEYDSEEENVEETVDGSGDDDKSVYSNKHINTKYVVAHRRPKTQNVHEKSAEHNVMIQSKLDQTVSTDKSEEATYNTSIKENSDIIDDNCKSENVPEIITKTSEGITKKVDSLKDTENFEENTIPKNIATVNDVQKLPENLSGDSINSDSNPEIKTSRKADSLNVNASINEQYSTKYKPHASTQAETIRDRLIIYTNDEKVGTFVGSENDEQSAGVDEQIKITKNAADQSLQNQNAQVNNADYNVRQTQFDETYSSFQVEESVFDAFVNNNYKILDYNCESVDNFIHNTVQSVTEKVDTQKEKANIVTDNVDDQNTKLSNSPVTDSEQNLTKNISTEFTDIEAAYKNIEDNSLNVPENNENNKSFRDTRTVDKAKNANTVLKLVRCYTDKVISSLDYGDMPKTNLSRNRGNLSRSYVFNKPFGILMPAKEVVTMEKSPENPYSFEVSGEKKKYKAMIVNRITSCSLKSSKTKDNKLKLVPQDPSRYEISFPDHGRPEMNFVKGRKGIKSKYGILAAVSPTRKKYSCFTGQLLTLYIDQQRIFQEHNYDALSLKRLNEVQKRKNSHYQKYSRKSEKEFENSDGENERAKITLENRSNDNLVTEEVIKNKNGKLNESETDIHLNKYFPQSSTDLINLKNIIDRAAIDNYKGFDVTNEDHNCLETIQIKQEPNPVLEDYGYENLQLNDNPNFSDIDLICHEEIDIKQEPLETDTTTLSADEFERDYTDFTYVEVPIEYTSHKNDEQNISFVETNDETSEIEPCSALKTSDNVSNKIGDSNSDFDEDEPEESMQEQISKILENLEADEQVEAIIPQYDLLEAQYVVDLNDVTYENDDTPIIKKSHKRPRTKLTQKKRPARQSRKRKISDKERSTPKQRISRSQNKTRSNSSSAAKKIKTTGTNENLSKEIDSELENTCKQRRKSSNIQICDDTANEIMIQNTNKEKVSEEIDQSSLTVTQQNNEFNQNNPSDWCIKSEDNKDLLEEFIENNKEVTLNEIQNDLSDDEMISSLLMASIEPEHESDEVASDLQLQQQKETSPENTDLRVKPLESLIEPSVSKELDNNKILVRIPLDAIKSSVIHK